LKTQEFQGTYDAGGLKTRREHRAFLPFMQQG
jgi:hypothetical protein